MSHLHFHFLTGDVNWQEYGGKFISRKLNNGDFDYWLVLEVSNMKDATGDESAETYNVMLCAVSPDAMSKETFDSAWKSWGMGKTFEEWQNELAERFNTQPSHAARIMAEARVEVAYDGGRALLWQDSGNNLKKLLTEAHKHADTEGDFLFGFAMDRAQNRIGSTGWDCITGDMLAGLRRMSEGEEADEDSNEG